MSACPVHPDGFTGTTAPPETRPIAHSRCTCFDTPTSSGGGALGGSAVDALAALVERLRDLDYSPSEEAWVCGPHGVPECSQETCPDLPWPKPNESNLLAAFMTWADGEFRRVVQPYDFGSVPEMPDESFRSYSLWEWPIGDALPAIAQDAARTSRTLADLTAGAAEREHRPAQPDDLDRLKQRRDDLAARTSRGGVLGEDDEAAIAQAMDYARRYWTFGNEPETQAMLTVLARTVDHLTTRPAPDDQREGERR